MNLYIKQKLFSWGDKFSIYDEQGNERYYVCGEVFTLGKKLRIFDPFGNELAYIEQKLVTLLPKYNIWRSGAFVTEVVKEFSFFHPRYTAPQIGWEIDGDFLDHDYCVCGNGRPIADVSKQWFTLGDAYELRISPDADEVNVLAVVLVIDACIAAQKN